MTKAASSQVKNSLSNLVDDLQVVVLGLRLQLCRPVDEPLRLHCVLVLHVQPGDLEVRLQLVVHRVLLLAVLQRDAGEDLRGLAPVVLALVDVGQVLADEADLMKESLPKRTIF